MEKRAQFVHTSVTFRTEGLVCQDDGRGIVRRSRAELDQVGSDYRVQFSFVLEDVASPEAQTTPATQQFRQRDTRRSLGDLTRHLNSTGRFLPQPGL